MLPGGSRAALSCRSRASSRAHPPFSGHLEGGRVYGRGVMDDKAGVTIALALLELLADEALRPAGDLVFQFVREDETNGTGSPLCLEAGHTGGAVVVRDGTRLDRATQRHAVTRSRSSSAARMVGALMTQYFIKESLHL